MCTQDSLIWQTTSSDNDLGQDCMAHFAHPPGEESSLSQKITENDLEMS